MNVTRRLITTSIALALVGGYAACSDPIASAPDWSAPDGAAADRVSGPLQDQQWSYGKAVKVGDGQVRTYIVTDKKDRNVPLEIGVAMTENALNGLPAGTSMSMGAGAEPMQMNMYLLDLPEKNPTTYKFVQFDWNPNGHEPAGVYDLPHFDFHFYTVPVSVRNSIVPTDPQYAQKAANFPAAQYRAPFYIDAATAAGAPPAAVTVPQMGLHWLDVRSPELQGMAGNPAGYKPFTRTFIYGSWDGAFIFDEPMITRAYILAKRTATDPAVQDEVIPVSVPAQHAIAGYYPNAYRITYDAKAKEYRISLTQLTKQQ